MIRPRSIRRAFTLVELVASMAGASILVAGMASTMFVALRASNPTNTPAAGMLAALTCMSDMSAELQYATSPPVFSSSPPSLTVTVPDRSDADTATETIRYAWSGVAGAPLTRSYNGGTAVAVIPSVHAVSVDLGMPEFMIIRVQPTTSSRSVVETSITFLNL